MWASALLNSGLTLNRLWLARLLGRFPALGRLLRLRLSPELLASLNNLEPSLENGTLYASAVTWMRTGRVMKTVGLHRNSLADARLIELARSRDLPRIADIGASDGSASLRLLESLPGARIRLFDKYNFFQVRPRTLGCEVFNAAGERIYRRLGPLLLYLYDRPPVPAEGPLRRIPVKNPLLRRFPVEIEDFDLFEEDLGGDFDLIKCCNCLNLEFYPGEKLYAGIVRLLGSLREGGCLLVGQNHADYPEGEAYFVLQRRGTGSVLMEQRNGHRLLEWLRTHRPGVLGGA